MKRKLIIFASFAFLGALVVILWFASFLSFVDDIQNYAYGVEPDSAVVADAIVVPTGGSERISTGIDLLRHGKAKKLLISGVGAKNLLALREIPKEIVDCCVVLGHEAEDTRGNALETRAFMIGNAFTSMRLVTAHYHMPRTLLLFHAVMPGVRILPHPVHPPTVNLFLWWLRPHTFGLLLTEHAKYLLEMLRPFRGGI